METNQVAEKAKPLNAGIDFKRLVGALLTKWYWFVMSISFFVSIGWTYLRYTVPEYAMRSSILIDDKQRTGASTVINTINSSQPGNANQGSNMFNEMFVMRSQDLVGKMVDSLGLYTRYYSQGRIKEDEIYETCPIRLEFDSNGYVGEGMIELRLNQKTDGLFIFKDGPMVNRVLYNTWVKRPYGRFRIVYFKGNWVNRGYLTNHTEIIVRVQNPKSTTGQLIGKFGVNLSDGRTSLLDLYFSDNIRARGVDFLNAVIFFYQKKGVGSE
jgi:hypothetical protein